jgi:hypothetical protein
MGECVEICPSGFYIIQVSDKLQRCVACNNNTYNFKINSPSCSKCPEFTLNCSLNSF